MVFSSAACRDISAGRWRRVGTRLWAAFWLKGHGKRGGKEEGSKGRSYRLDIGGCDPGVVARLQSAAIQVWWLRWFCDELGLAQSTYTTAASSNPLTKPTPLTKATPKKTPKEPIPNN